MTRTPVQPNISYSAETANVILRLGLTPMRVHLALQEKQGGSISCLSEQGYRAGAVGELEVREKEHHT